MYIEQSDCHNTTAKEEIKTEKDMVTTVLESPGMSWNLNFVLESPGMS